MDKKNIESLKFYYENASTMDAGIAKSTVEALTDLLDRITADEVAAAKKRQPTNKSGVLQIDTQTGEVIATFNTQKEALAALGKDSKSGISDAINGRVKTHKSLGYGWYFKDQYPGAKEALKVMAGKKKKAE